MSENIRVAVRCRPFNGREREMQCASVVQVEGSNVVRLRNPQQPNADPRMYTFDFAYDDQSTQDGVYADLGQPIVSKAVDGFNSTMFAYGQTGSGKTFTMMGSKDTPGIIPRLIVDVFRQVQELQSDERQFQVFVSYLEIYKEVVKDLLNPSDRKLAIRESPKLGIYVDQLAILLASTEDDVMRLIEEGNAVRKVASTKMNASSSRSHSVFTMTVEQKMTEEIGDMQRQTALTAKVNLVDLAGSERAAKTGATGSTLKEGAMINRSLLTLGTVINRLSEGALKRGEHIPYRDSKLTRLLQESLGGNSATLMVAAISPADNNFDETLSTLQYANRAKSIENAVVRNEDVNEKIISELKKEIENLRRALEQGGGLAGGLAAASDGEAAGAMRQRLEEAEKERDEMRNRQWEERAEMARQLEAERQRNVNTTISEAMDTVRAQKLEKMKAIKRLQNEKQQLQRKHKQRKEDYSRLRGDLESEINKFQRLQKTLGDGSAALDAQARETTEAEMDAIITVIERKKEEVLQCRNALTSIKERLREVDDGLVEERADLVSQAELLSVNNRMKEQLREEVQREWESQRERLVEETFKQERDRLAEEKEEHEKEYMQRFMEFRSKVQTEHDREKALLEERIGMLENEKRELQVEAADLRTRVGELEGRVADSEVDLEAAQQEHGELRMKIQGLKEQQREQLDKLREDMRLEMEEQQRAHEEEVQDLRHEQELRVAEASADGAKRWDRAEAKAPGADRGADFSEADYDQFKTLMAIFDDEREAWRRKYEEKVELLNEMTRDIIELSAERTAGR